MRALKRRDFLRLAAAGTGLLTAAACQPKIVKETVLMPATPEVIEKIVKETVIVEGTPKVVEKIIKETVVVAPTPATKEKVLIRNIVRGGSADTIPWFDRFAEEFMEAHPNIRIEYIHTPSAELHIKLRTMIAAGDAPEVGMPLGGRAQWYRSPKASLWLALDPYMEASGIKRSEFSERSLEAALNPFTRTMEGIPSQLFLGVYGYNKDLFAKAGVPEPPNDWNDTSWNVDYFLEIALKLTLDKNGKHPDESGFDPTNIDQWAFHDFRGITKFGMYGFLFGGEGPQTESADPRTVKMRVAEPKFVQGVQWAQDLVHKYHVSPMPYEVEQFAGLLPTIFHTGKLAIDVIASYNLEKYKGITDFEWAICPTISGPQANFDGVPRKYKRICIDNGYITAESKHHEEAWAWVSFCSSPEIAGMYAVDMRNCLPGRISSRPYHDQRLGEIWPNLDVSVLSKGLDHQYYHQYWRPPTEWEAVYTSYCDRIRVADSTAEDALTEAEPIIQANWDEYYSHFD